MGPLVESVYQGREKTTEGVVTFLNKVCEMELEKYIDRCYEELATYVNAYDQKMFMKRENIAERGIWTAKKRYILNVWDSEGVRYDEPKLKMMGIEAVKSSTPAPCRTMIKDGLKLMMNGTEEDVIDFIDKCRVKFKELPPEEIAFPRSVSDVVKYRSHADIYSKGTPIHCRGALLYNHYLKEKKLTNKYSLINNGEKIKFLYLKKPNIIQENVISFIQDFPHELGLDKYIDYDLQFEKSFVEPLKSILDAIGWNVEKTVNLELFLGNGLSKKIEKRLVMTTPNLQRTLMMLRNMLIRVRTFLTHLFLAVFLAAYLAIRLLPLLVSLLLARLSFLSLLLKILLFDSNPDGYCLYFDTEAAVNKSLLASRGLPLDRVVVVNVVTVEEFRSKALKAVDLYLKNLKTNANQLCLC